MSIRRSEQHRRQVAEQAAEWMTLLKSGKLSAQERGEFVDWLRESPVHIAEMLRISRIEQALGENIRWDEIARDTPGEQDNVVTLADFKVQPARHRSDRAAVTRWVAAAGVAALTMLGAWAYVSHDNSVIRTQIGERREVTLADGSVVNVAPSSELRVRLKDKERLITLARGQAFFHVAKDANRPFIVDAGDTQVRAVGTAFNVARSGEGVKVTVVEGRVAVTRDASSLDLRSAVSQPSRIYLSANEQAVVTATVEKIPVFEVNGTAETAWTDGNLVFNDETVAEVVRRFNLYNRAQIKILNEALATRRVSGVFKASDPESFIAFVKSSADEVHPEYEMIQLDVPAN